MDYTDREVESDLASPSIRRGGCKADGEVVADRNA